jgi:hypothetical protein
LGNSKGLRPIRDLMVAIIRPDVVGWAPRALMMIDAYESGDKGDGFITLAKAQAHREALEARRDQYARTHAEDSMLQALQRQAEAARKLEKNIRDAEQWTDEVRVQYLPDDITNLDRRLRMRATDILMHDDPDETGKISSTMLLRASERYQQIQARTPGSLRARTEALAEISDLARVLGLRPPS